MGEEGRREKIRSLLAPGEEAQRGGEASRALRVLGAVCFIPSKGF